MLNSGVALRTRRALVSSGVLVVAALVMFVPIPEAIADECVPVTLPDGVVIPCEGSGGGGDNGGGDEEENPGGGVPQTCDYLGAEIPCSSQFGSWDGDCYVRAAVPQPPNGSGAWEGHDDGYILECTPYPCAQAGGDLTACEGHSFYWSPDAPAPVGPSAEELARQAVASMQLTMGEIGSTPPSSNGAPSSVGAIGLPIWLWIANPADNTTGPITSTPQPGVGLSVTATGTLDRVEWTLTTENGATVGAISCDGPNAAGTPYDGRNSAEPSPTCGFGADLNSSPGNLTLTGTSHWIVEWQSTNGESGQILFTSPPRSTQIRIGELQVLVQD